MRPPINLHEMLLEDFGIDLPISGGTGNSESSPIVIHYRDPNDYVATEYTVLRMLGVGRRITWELLQEHTYEKARRRLEQMKIRAQWIEGENRITQVENYYFDITECFGKQ